MRENWIEFGESQNGKRFSPQTNGMFFVILTEPRGGVSTEALKDSVLCLRRGMKACKQRRPGGRHQHAFHSESIRPWVVPLFGPPERLRPVTQCRGCVEICQESHANRVIIPKVVISPCMTKVVRFSHS